MESKLWCSDCHFPKDSPLKEEKIFSGIAEIFNAVADAVRKLGIAEPVIFLKDDLKRTPASNAAHRYKTRPDAVHLLNNVSV